MLSVYSKLKWEAGVYRVQQVPATKTHSSFSCADVSKTLTQPSLLVPALHTTHNTPSPLPLPTPTQVNGDSVYSKLKREAGVHRVQRVPASKAAGNILSSPHAIDVVTHNLLQCSALLCSAHHRPKPITSHR